MKKTYLLNVVINTILALTLGIIMVSVNTGVLIKTVSMIVGAIVIILNIPDFITGVTNPEKITYNILFLLSIVNITLGILIMFYPESWVYIVFGIWFLVLPIYKIFVAEDKKQELIDQLTKLTMGIFLIILGPQIMVMVAVRIIGYVIIALTLLYLFGNLYAYSKLK